MKSDVIADKARGKGWNEGKLLADYLEPAEFWQYLSYRGEEVERARWKKKVREKYDRFCETDPNFSERYRINQAKRLFEELLK